MLVLVSLLGAAWVDVWAPHRHGGATPAMGRLGPRIVRIDGSTPRVRDHVVRSLLFSVNGLFLGLPRAVLIAVTPRHQRLGDLVTRTVVVRVLLLNPSGPGGKGAAFANSLAGLEPEVNGK